MESVTNLSHDNGKYILKLKMGVKFFSALEHSFLPFSLQKVDLG
jgi:hypothetical protein